MGEGGPRLLNQQEGTLSPQMGLTLFPTSILQMPAIPPSVSASHLLSLSGLVGALTVP